MAYIGDSRVAELLRSRRNLTSRGYPSSYTPSTGTGGLNLTTLGYPSSTEGYYGGNVSTTNVSGNGGSSVSSRGSGSYSTSASGAGDTAAADGINQYEEYIKELKEEIQRLKDDSEERRKNREEDIKIRKEERKEDQEIRERERKEDYEEREKQRQQEIKEKEAKANALQKLVTQYKKEMKNRSEYRTGQRKTAKDAYDKGVSSAQTAYNTQKGSLDRTLASLKKQLLDTLNSSKGTLNQNAENSLRQAYINNMLAQRGLSQQLSAQGINGGATESTLAAMRNNYGNQRNNINTTLNNNLKELTQGYNSDVAAADRDYQNNLASANTDLTNRQAELYNTLMGNYMNIENQYQDLVNQDQQGYYNLLKEAAQYAMPGTTKTTTTNNSKNTKTTTNPGTMTNANYKYQNDGPLMKNNVPGTMTSLNYRMPNDGPLMYKKKK